MHSDHQHTWETYTAAWKAAGADDKRALMAASLAPECSYQDPLTQANGQDELMAYMLRFHQQVPGAHFVTRRFRAHNGQSLAEWEMRDAQGKAIGDGASVGRYNAAGRLVAIAGFFDI